MADGAGDGHTDQHQSYGNHLVHIVKVHVLQTLQHQHANIDQGSGGCGCGDDGSDGGDEHTGQEQDAAGKGSQAGTAAGFHAGSGLDEGGDGGGAGAGAGDGADGVGQQGLLHVGHIAVLIHHVCSGCGAHQGADGIKHVDDAEGNHQGDDGEPADFQEACKIELEEGGLHHVSEGRQEGSGGQGCKGIGIQESEGACPVDHGGNEHAEEDGALDAILGHGHDGKQANKHGDNGQDHSGVTGVAHVGLQHAGGQSAKEVTHDEEGGGEAVALGVDAHVGAQADVHQHQADGGRNAQADAQRNGLHDLLPDIEDGQDHEHNTLNQDDDQSGLEGSHIGHTGHGNNVAHDHSKEAVQAHAGGHAEGLVGQEGHAEHADGGCDTGGHEHAVPELGALSAEIGQQIGVQSNDVGHGHEGGQTGNQFGFDVGAVFRQFKNLFKHIFFPFFSWFFLVFSRIPIFYHQKPIYQLGKAPKS